jgi:hypothetical protein
VAESRVFARLAFPAMTPRKEEHPGMRTSVQLSSRIMVQFGAICLIASTTTLGGCAPEGANPSVYLPTPAYAQDAQIQFLKLVGEVVDMNRGLSLERGHVCV